MRTKWDEKYESEVKYYLACYVNDEILNVLIWYLTKLIAMGEKFSHLIMKFKINDAAFFGDAQLSQTSFLNFSTDF